VKINLYIRKKGDSGGSILKRGEEEDRLEDTTRGRRKRKKEELEMKGLLNIKFKFCFSKMSVRKLRKSG